MKPRPTPAYCHCLDGVGWEETPRIEPSSPLQENVGEKVV
jgi:hypothetical protein